MMKKTVLLFVFLLALLLVQGALADDPTYTYAGVTYTYTTEQIGEKSYAAAITGVSDVSGSALIIPASIDINPDPLPVKEIAQSAFKGCPALEYIRFVHDSDAMRAIPDGAFNLSALLDLEAVYFNFAITEKNQNTIVQKFTFKTDDSGKQVVPRLLQYKALSNDTLTIVKDSPQYNQVVFSFNDLLHALPGYGYRVDRQEGNSTEEFDSLNETNTSFGISDGTVTFTDGSVTPGKTYEYTVSAFDPFGSPKAFASVSVPVPYAPGLLLPDSSWGNVSFNETLDAKLPGDDTSGTQYRLKLSPIGSETFSGDIKEIPIDHKLLEFTPTNALAFNLTPQHKSANSDWTDCEGAISLSASLPLNKLIPEGRMIRHFTVLHLDQDNNSWDREDLECAIIDASFGEENVSPDFPVTVSGNLSLSLNLSHFSPYAILWEEVPVAAIESLPDTGDAAPLLPWLMLLGASALLLLRRNSLRSN